MQSSLRRLQGVLTGGLPALVVDSQTDDSAFNALGWCYERLVLEEDGYIDTSSTKACHALHYYLMQLEILMDHFNIAPVDRSYREQFPIDFSELSCNRFPMTVLEGCSLFEGEFWLNGDRQVLSGQAQEQAQQVHRAWLSLNDVVANWRRLKRSPNRTELFANLQAFDTEFVRFEKMYVAELIEIEDRARLPLVKAIKAHHALRRAEDFGGRGRSFVEEKACLIRCVGHLNSLANSRGLGRDDLGADIWQRAAAVFLGCQDSSSSAPCNAAGLLAQGVLDSIAALREYLAEAEHQMFRVHPNLADNEGLVDRLVDWEDSWLTFYRFATSDGAMNPLNTFVKRLAEVRQNTTGFAALCENMDAELFVVLPRVLLLCYLWDPKLYAETVHGLLPVRFEDAPTSPGPELCNLQELFDQAMRKLSARGAGAGWQTLVRCAVGGRGSSREAMARTAADLLPAQREEAKGAVSALMHELEGLSVDLQRHAPVEWNRWAAVVLQCLEGKPIVPKRHRLGPELLSAADGGA